MKQIQIVRVAQGKNTTLSHLYIGGFFACYLLEDAIRPEKVPGVTCIPEGEYGLSFNVCAGMNARYVRNYPKWHEGMIEITEIPNYQLVFIHIGNYHTDTAGCPLTGSYWQLIDDDYRVLHSAAAYKYVYPLLVKEIEQGNDRVTVYNRCSTSGSPSLR